MKDQNVKYADYVREDALDTLLSDLTREASELLAVIANKMPGDEWLVIDIHTIGDDYQAWSRDERNGQFTTFDIDDAYPVLRFALKEDLLQRSALISSLHPNHQSHETTDVIRLCLSEGVRTPRSQSKGFRWDLDDDYMYETRHRLIREDVNALAYELVERLTDYEVKWLKATTEEIKVVVKRQVVATIPFDHYPFLGVEILKQDNQKLTGYLLDDLNDAITSMYESSRTDRLFEEHEEARMRGDTTGRFW